MIFLEVLMYTYKSKPERVFSELLNFKYLLRIIVHVLHDNKSGINKTMVYGL